MAEESFPETVRDQIRRLGEDDASTVVQDWVDRRQQEDLYLDFTEKTDRSKGTLDGDDRRAFAKAVSGFANSDGGLLVWGVEARKPKGDREAADEARESKPISPLATFVGELNNIVKDSTKPAVPGVQNLKIQKDQQANLGWVVTYVPAGPAPPYRAENDNKNHFYKRAGSSFYPMEPYDIRDVVFRFRYPKIQLDIGFEEGRITQDEHVYWLVLNVFNAGPSALREYKLQVEMPRFVPLASAGPQHDPTEIDTPTDGIWRWERYSAGLRPEECIIYPGEGRQLVGPNGILHVQYRINREAYKRMHRRAWPTQPVAVCRLLGVDMPPVEVDKPLRELQKF